MLQPYGQADKPRRDARRRQLSVCELAVRGGGRVQHTVQISATCTTLLAISKLSINFTAASPALHGK